jgi:hypothetical protein
MTLLTLLTGWVIIAAIFAALFSPLLERRAAGALRGKEQPAASAQGRARFSNPVSHTKGEG